MSESRLRRAAREVAGSAYCPYSQFRVGAAVETVHGAIHAGCNVENASYGLTCCAERNALFTAIAAGTRPGEIQSMAIYTSGDVAHASCGACRQVMIELAPGANVTSFCDGGAEITIRVEDLLPAAFALPEPDQR